MTYTTKDSGKRIEYASGMKRDIQEGKPMLHHAIASDIPYQEQMLVRFGELLGRGAEKYGERNFELAYFPEEIERFKGSALRHLIQWMCDEDDEDHAAAVMFNVLAAEHASWRLRRQNGN